MVLSVVISAVYVAFFAVIFPLLVPVVYSCGFLFFPPGIVLEFEAFVASFHPSGNFANSSRYLLENLRSKYTVISGSPSTQLEKLHHSDGNVDDVRPAAFRAQALRWHAFFAALGLLLMYALHQPYLKFSSRSVASHGSWKSWLRRHHRVLGVVEILCCFLSQFYGRRLIPTAYGKEHAHATLWLQSDTIICLTALSVVSILPAMVSPAWLAPRNCLRSVSPTVHGHIQRIRVCYLASVGVVERFIVMCLLPLVRHNSETDYLFWYSYIFISCHWLGWFVGVTWSLYVEMVLKSKSELRSQRAGVATAQAKQQQFEELHVTNMSMSISLEVVQARDRDIVVGDDDRVDVSEVLDALEKPIGGASPGRVGSVSDNTAAVAAARDTKLQEDAAITTKNEAVGDADVLDS